MDVIIPDAPPPERVRGGPTNEVGSNHAGNKWTRKSSSNFMLYK